MKEVYSVLVLMHPLNHKGCFEILFSSDGKRYSSIDSNGPDYFKEQGLTTACRFEVTPAQFYRLLAKSLEMKLLLADLHTKYKDYSNTMILFKKIAVRCVSAQSKYSEDLQIPEVVIQLANSVLILPKTIF